MIDFYPQLPRCDRVSWNENATTLVDKSFIQSKPHTVFVDNYGHIYMADYNVGKILVWNQQQSDPLRTLSVSLSVYTDIFVDLNGDIYFERGSESGRIDKWPSYANQSITVAKFGRNCFGLFIDRNNDLYCSLFSIHKIMKIFLNHDYDTPIGVAGTGYEGSAAPQLYRPWGIFIDQQFTLYVADSLNNRIQQFKHGESNGTTVAGQEVPNALKLNLPTDLILDNKGTLYIADARYHQIIKVDGDQWKCIVGCISNETSAANQFSSAIALQFDRHYNLYVVDEFNQRIQKFKIIHNKCRKLDKT